MAKKGIHAEVNVFCYGREGTLKWKEENLHNIWHNEGELYMLYPFAKTYSGYGAPVDTLYIGLDARETLAETDTLASLTGEPSGSGYARVAKDATLDGTSGNSWWVAEVDGAAYQAKTSTTTFTANGGDWAAVKNIFLCTHATATTSAQDQRLLSSVALSVDRTLYDGDSLVTEFTVKVSES